MSVVAYNGKDVVENIAINVNIVKTYDERKKKPKCEREYEHKRE